MTQLQLMKLVETDWEKVYPQLLDYYIQVSNELSILFYE